MAKKKSSIPKRSASSSKKPSQNSKGFTSIPKKSTKSTPSSKKPASALQTPKPKNQKAAQKVADQFKFIQDVMAKSPKSQGMQKGGGRPKFFEERRTNTAMEKAKKAFPGNEALFPEPFKVPERRSQPSPTPSPAASLAAAPKSAAPKKAAPPPPPPASSPAKSLQASADFGGFGQDSFVSPALKPSTEAPPEMPSLLPLPSSLEPPTPNLEQPQAPQSQTLQAGQSSVVRDGPARLKRRNSRARLSGQMKLGTGQLRINQGTSGTSTSRVMPGAGLTRNTGLSIGGAGLMK